MKDWSQIEKDRNEVYNHIRSFFDKGLNLKAYEYQVIKLRQTINERHLLAYFDRIAERFHHYTRKREWKIKNGFESAKQKRVHFKLTDNDRLARKMVARENAERAQILHSKHKKGPSEWVEPE